MFEDLDHIDWAALRHAHGAATDTPGHLRALLTEDDDERLQIIATLHETLWHQGNVYSASPVAVPFLYELMNSPDLPMFPVREGMASLVAVIADGEGVLESGVRWDGEEVWRRRLAERGQTLEDARAEEAAVLDRIHSEVSVGLRDLLPYMRADGLGLAIAAILGDFPEHASWLVPAIDEALGAESNEEVRRTLSESKARLAGSS